MRDKLFFILILMTAHALQSQTIWPGDVNNNGIVNAVDLLYCGIAYGAEGPEREDGNIAWIAQPYPGDWSQSYPIGINYAYADCDGDGSIDDDDIDAIVTNFGQTNPPIGPDAYANAAAAAPQLRLTPDVTLVEEGATINVALSFDVLESSLTDFYGVAMKLSYSTDLLESGNGPDFELLDGTWMDGDDDGVEHIYVDDNGQGSAQLGITRTNQQSVAAENGVIGQFELIVEDIIVGLEVDTFVLSIDSIFLINEQMSIRSIIPDTARIVIARDTSDIGPVGTENVSLSQNAPSIHVYPNPTSGELYIESTVPVESIRLFNTAGQLWREEKESPGALNSQLSLATMPAGVYWLQVLSANGVATRRIVIQRP